MMGLAERLAGVARQGERAEHYGCHHGVGCLVGRKDLRISSSIGRRRNHIPDL
jgi:hypothetical protein